MANPNTLPDEMRLYSHAEPEGRVFLKGEPWPGDAWSIKPGGETVGSGTTTQALKDLIAAQEQIENLQRQLDTALHSSAQADQGASAVSNRVAELEQQVIAANAARETAEAEARAAVAERDQARAELAQAPSVAAPPPVDERTAFRTQLDALGIDYDGRAGVETLRKLLADAVAAPAA